MSFYAVFNVNVDISRWASSIDPILVPNIFKTKPAEYFFIYKRGSYFVWSIAFSNYFRYNSSKIYKHVKAILQGFINRE